MFWTYEKIDKIQITSKGFEDRFLQRNQPLGDSKEGGAVQPRDVKNANQLWRKR